MVRGRIGKRVIARPLLHTAGHSLLEIVGAIEGTPAGLPRNVAHGFVRVPLARRLAGSSYTDLLVRAQAAHRGLVTDVDPRARAHLPTDVNRIYRHPRCGEEGGGLPDGRRFRIQIADLMVRLVLLIGKLK